jgi:flagellar biosynthesis/type III secretory pathway protein FliH
MQSDAKPDDLIGQAKAEVDNALKKADEEIAGWVKEAQESGVKQGFEQAEQFRAKLQKLQETLLAEVEGEVVRAAFDVAGNILNAELSASPDAVVHVVQNALKSVQEVSQVWLRVNPADAQTLRDHKQKLIDVLGRAKDVDVREDKQVERGGVLIQTESGVIDAQLKTQLEEIARVLGV